MNPSPHVAPFFVLSLLAGCGGIAAEPSASRDETQEVDEPRDDPVPEEPMIPVERLDCSCGAGDYFIELTLPNETLRFTLPASPSPPPFDCDTVDKPFFFLGGSCISTMLSACDTSGRCVVVRPNELTVVSSDGSVLLALKSPLYEADPFISLGDGPWTNDAPIVGEISIGEDGIEVESSSIAAPILPLLGRYSLCYVGGDFCLR